MRTYYFVLDVYQQQNSSALTVDRVVVDGTACQERSDLTNHGKRFGTVRRVLASNTRAPKPENMVN